MNKKQMTDALNEAQKKSYIGPEDFCVKAIKSGSEADILEAKLALAKQDGWDRAIYYVTHSIVANWKE